MNKLTQLRDALVLMEQCICAPGDPDVDINAWLQFERVLNKHANTSGYVTEEECRRRCYAMMCWCEANWESVSDGAFYEWYAENFEEKDD